MTPDEARLSISDLYRATRDAIGGSWEIEAHTWFGCEGSEGLKGPETATFHMGGTRFDQDLPREPDEVARRVQSLWASLGIDAEIVFDSSIPQHRLSYPRFGAGPTADGYIVQFAVSPRYAAFSGHSRCVPGDSYELDLSEVGRHDE